MNMVLVCQSKSVNSSDHAHIAHQIQYELFFVANLQALKKRQHDKFPAIKAINQARGVSPVQSEKVTTDSIEVFQT